MIKLPLDAVHLPAECARDPPQVTLDFSSHVCLQLISRDWLMRSGPLHGLFGAHHTLGPSSISPGRNSL
jgi:hypothetical protein